MTSCRLLQLLFTTRLLLCAIKGSDLHGTSTTARRSSSSRSSCIVNRRLTDLGLLEVSVHCPEEGVWAQEVQLEGHGEKGLFYRQQAALEALEMGGVLVKTFYGHSRLLLHCAVSVDKAEVKDFISTFGIMSEENAINVTVDGIGNIEYDANANHTGSNFALDSDMSSLIDVPKARKECIQKQQFIQELAAKEQLSREPEKEQYQYGNTMKQKSNYTSRKLSEKSLRPNAAEDKKDEEGKSVSLGENGNNASRRKRFLRPAGTKWCGPGDSAGTYWDLGEERSADLCCREHDHCGRQIAPFSSGYGLFNWRPYTVVDCSCDESFRSCLQDAGTDTAHMVGTVYFDVFRPACFRTFIGKGCLSRSWWGWCYRFGQTQVTHMQRSVSYSQN